MTGRRETLTPQVLAAANAAGDEATIIPGGVVMWLINGERYTPGEAAARYDIAWPSRKDG